MSCETICETVTGSIVALLDGELAEAERREVVSHLASCTACARELSDLEATRGIIDRHLRAAGGGIAATGFDDLWRRVGADDPGPVRTVRIDSGATRPSSVSRASRGRRRWLWAGVSAGAALAAGLALFVLAPRLPGTAPTTRDAPRTGGPAVASAPVPKAVVAKSAQGSATRVAKGGSDDGAGAKEQVARRAGQKPAPAEPAPEEESAAAVAVNELDPPRELLERPDLFLNYPIVRKLEELRHLDAVLADHGTDDQPDDGGAG